VINITNRNAQIATPPFSRFPWNMLAIAVCDAATEHLPCKSGMGRKIAPATAARREKGWGSAYTREERNLSLVASVRGG
jgi:hypothetical protein